MRTVYFNEYNVRMAQMCYLPLVSGLLRVYAETSESICKNYSFQPFVYHIDSFDNILNQYSTPPDVAAFSVSMWNEQLNLNVAREVKRRWPHCLVVFGGAQVPHRPVDYMQTHRFIDVAVRAEGEEAFSEILQRHLETDDFRDIPHVTFRRGEDIVVNDAERPHRRELDSYPSPYLQGVYDYLIQQRSNTLDFQAIIETNRGCPFECTFCYWGRGGLSRKYRYHDMDRVLAEIDWCGRNSIAYVFNADSNFGMHRRDQEIADFIVQTKKKYGFPDKFRTCFGKNTDEKIFKIGRLFHENNLEKGITLARQSNDAATLANIKRSNIKMETYASLQRRFNEEQVPVYSELILGLPGETVESWKRGIDEMLSSGLRNQLFTYLCQVYPNTELADPEYRRRFAIVTRRIELNEIHGSIRDQAWVKEYEDIVVETATMPFASWRQMAVLSWLAMSLHSMKLAYFLLIYLRDRFNISTSAFLEYIATRRAPVGGFWTRELDFYNAHIDRMIEAGIGRGIVMGQYGDIYWDVEEATFLRAAEDADAFYEELEAIAVAFLADQRLDFDAREVREVVRYQRARIPEPHLPEARRYEFAFNLPDYFDQRFTLYPVPLSPVSQGMTVMPIDFAGDRKRFARETILWGRKSGTMLVRSQLSPRVAGAANAAVSLS